MDTNHLFDEKTALWLFGDKRQSLQELASFQFAWKLWSDIMLSGKYHDYKSELMPAMIITMRVLTKQVKDLRLSSSVENQITQAVLTIQQSLTLWVVYHQEQMLCGLRLDPSSPARKIILYTCHLKYATFKTNGDMDFESSARKMLKAKQFNKKISFEIMSRFCMEDELRKLPIEQVRELKEKFSFDRNPLAWYWICYLTGELKRGIPRFVYTIYGDCCVYGFILTTHDCENWSNIQYFWNELCDEQDKARKACEVLVNINLNWFLNNFYWKMNADQWRFVFETIPVDILIVFFRQYGEIDKGLFIWKRMKGMLTRDLFLDLMEKVLIEKTKGDWSIPLAMQLWQTAEDHLKNHVLTYEDSIIANNFFEPVFIRKFDKSLVFLFDLLSFASIQYRKQMILKHGDVLFMSDDLPGIDKIIQLCLRKARDLAQFKKSLTKSTLIKLRVEQLLIDGKFAHLNKFFDDYFPNEPATKTYKKKALESNEKGCQGFIFEPTVWSEFEKLIDSVHGPFAATSIKKRYIRSFKLHSIKDRGNIEQLNYLEDIVSRFFTEEEEVELKKTLLTDLANKLANFVTSYSKHDDDKGKFVDAGFLDKFVSWCCMNDQKIKKFKRAFPMDKIFANVVKSITCYVRCENMHLEKNMPMYSAIMPHGSINRKILSALDEFFKWYFDGVEQAKKFKLAKMFAFDDVELFKNLNLTAEFDSRDTGTFIVWLLGNDDEQIREFKARLSELKMAPMPEAQQSDDGKNISQPKAVCSYDAILNAI